jgi:ribose transport system substrate-binding protein
VSAAQAVATEFEKTPTSISITTPVGKPIPKGKTIDFIDCGIPTCAAVGQSLTAAGKVLGWTVKDIPASTEPAGAQQGFEQAIQNKPDGVAYTGIARAGINTQLSELAKMKIPVSTCCTTDATGAGLTNIMRRGASSTESGKIAAAYIVSTSAGKADTLYVDLPVFPIYAPYKAAFAKYYKQWCSSCGLSTLEMSATAIGKNAPQIIASYLAAHKSINYVFVVNDALGIGLPAAMTSAGVTGVKYVGSDSTEANFPAILSGQEVATIPASTGEFGWYEADILARAFAGVPQVNEATAEEQIWTKSNIPSNYASQGDQLALNPNYQSQFKKLWGIS